MFWTLKNKNVDGIILSRTESDFMVNAVQWFIFSYKDTDSDGLNDLPEIS